MSKNRSFRIPLDYKEHTNRAVHDLSEVCRTTLHVGPLTPVLFRRMYAGDKFIIKIPNVRVNSVALATPVMGNFRLRHEIVFQPDTNLYGFLANNDKKDLDFFLEKNHKNRFELPNFYVNQEDVKSVLGGYTSTDAASSGPLAIRQIDSAGNLSDFMGDLNSVFDYYLWHNGSVHPLLEYLTPYVDSIEDGSSFISDMSEYADPTKVFNVRPGSLADYLGFPSGYFDDSSRGYAADYVLTYMDYWRTYHRNTQETYTPFIRGAFIRNQTYNRDIFQDFDGEALDSLFRHLKSSMNGVDIDVKRMGFAYDSDSENPTLEQYSSCPAWQQKTLDYFAHIAAPAGCLFPTTYMPDLWRNILADDDSQVRSKVTVTDGKFSIEEFRYANRLQMLIDRFTVSGGRFSNWLQTIFGRKPKRQLNIPELCGVRTDWFGTTTVTNTAATSEAPLGTVGAKVDFSNGSNSAYTVNADVNGTLMIVVSIVPEVDYFQNLLPQLRDIEFIDEYFPQMANKGFDKIPLSDYVALPRFAAGVISPNGALDQVVGKNISWIKEMTSVNRLHGEFATNGLFSTWVLGRKYQQMDERNENIGLYAHTPGGDSVRPPFVAPGPPSAETAAAFIQWYNTPVIEKAYAMMFNLPTVDTSVDISTYVNPLDWQYLFETSGLEVAPFQYQAVFDIKAIRPIGRRYMPTLE